MMSHCYTAKSDWQGANILRSKQSPYKARLPVIFPWMTTANQASAISQQFQPERWWVASKRSLNHTYVEGHATSKRSIFSDFPLSRSLAVHITLEGHPFLQSQFSGANKETAKTVRKAAGCMHLRGPLDAIRKHSTHIFPQNFLT